MSNTVNSEEVEEIDYEGMPGLMSETDESSEEDVAADSQDDRLIGRLPNGDYGQLLAMLLRLILDRNNGLNLTLQQREDEETPFLGVAKIAFDPTPHQQTANSVDPKEEEIRRRVEELANKFKSKTLVEDSDCAENGNASEVEMHGASRKGKGKQKEKRPAQAEDADAPEAEGQDIIQKPKKKRTRKKAKKAAADTAGDQDPQDESISSAPKATNKKKMLVNPSDTASGRTIIDANSLSEMMNEQDRAFAGVARVCFGLDRDGGKGLHVTTRVINTRETTAGSLNKLVKVMGGDAKDTTKPLDRAARFNYLTAIKIMVSEENIDVSKVEKNAFGTNFPHLVYTAAAATSTDSLMILNGNNRFELVLRGVEPQITRATEIKASIATLMKKDTRTEEEVQQIVAYDAELTKLDAKIRAETEWGVLVYIKERISASMYKDEILLHLSSNHTIPQQKDSEQTTFTMVKDYLLRKPVDERRSTLLSAKENHSLAMPIELFQRLTKALEDTEFFMALAEFHRYSKLWPSTIGTEWIAPSSIYSGRFHTLPFVQTMMEHGGLVLDFLSSDFPLPKPDALGKPDLATIRERLAAQPLDIMRDLLDAKFFQNCNDLYKQYLFRHREKFSPILTNSYVKSSWDDAYPLYVRDMIQRATLWASGRAETFQSEYPDHTKKVLDALPQRLSLVLEHGLFNTTEHGLFFTTTPAPIPCSYFFGDFVKIFPKLGPWILYMFLWLEPFYGSLLTFQAFSGGLAMLEARMAQLRPKSGAKEAVRKFLSVIFACRSSDLLRLALKCEDLRLPPPKVLTMATIVLDESTKEVPWREIHKEVSDALRSWRSHAKTGEAHTVVKKSTRPTDTQFIFDKWDAKYHFSLNELFESTAAPWVSTISTNSHNRMGTMAQFVVEILQLFRKYSMTLREYSCYWDLRSVIQDTMESEFAGHLLWWDGITEPSIVIPNSSQPLGTEGNHATLKAKAMEMREKAEKVMAQITALLATPDMGSIPVLNDDDTISYSPHEDVHAAAIELFREVALASYKAQTIYLEPDQDRLQAITRSRKAAILPLFEFPGDFQPAGDGFVEAYYSPLTTEELDMVTALGEGSRAHQMRVQILEQRKMMEEARGHTRLSYILDTRDLIQMDDSDDEDSEEEEVTQEGPADPGQAETAAPVPTEPVDEAAAGQVEIVDPIEAAAHILHVILSPVKVSSVETGPDGEVQQGHVTPPSDGTQQHTSSTAPVEKEKDPSPKRKRDNSISTPDTPSAPPTPSAPWKRARADEPFSDDSMWGSGPADEDFMAIDYLDGNTAIASTSYALPALSSVSDRSPRSSPTPSQIPAGAKLTSTGGFYFDTTTLRKM
ncbi:hypothetical protein GALMADRAFT_148184 [Galerina marginata CBS 339.88]|uniref:Uncharacterized protein n=1 Tax=Galerina marginata (strain CBS 339.88) TaxID=685588 RepID=A0A067S5A3_GALM3|nr:hypothetical protein GALMADRAFT_148184 [Galerina marginata CBS 339.88]